MNTYRTREDLKHMVVDAFAKSEEVFQILLFGREAIGENDCFSDIDIVICSSEPVATQKAYRRIFASISPIRATFPLVSTANEYAEMLMLKDYSPYHKIDFSIVRNKNDKAWAKPFLSVYATKMRSPTHSARLNVLPIRRDIVQTLNDILFSVPRFTKCLFRQDFDMYRRWKSITDVTLALLHQKQTGWQEEALPKVLPPHELKWLREKLNFEDRQLFDEIYPSDGKLNLATSYQQSVRLFINLSKQKATQFDIMLDGSFIRYITRFMDSETARFLNQNSN